MIEPFVGHRATDGEITRGIVSKTAGPDRQGEILGVNAGIQSLSNALPPLLAGLIAARLTPEAPVAVGAMICLLGWMAFGLTTRAARRP
jgi:predicted MFS family arabinose efflux permease